MNWIEDAGSLDTAERFHFLSGLLELYDTPVIALDI
jgi:hypothetical protein